MFPFLQNTAEFRNPAESNLNLVPNMTFPSREEWERSKADIYAGRSKLDNRVGGDAFSFRLSSTCLLQCLPSGDQSNPGKPSCSNKECAHNKKYIQYTSIYIFYIYSSLKSLKSLGVSSRIRK